MHLGHHHVGPLDAAPRGNSECVLVPRKVVNLTEADAVGTAIFSTLGGCSDDTIDMLALRTEITPD